MSAAAATAAAEVPPEPAGPSFIDEPAGRAVLD